MIAQPGQSSMPDHDTPHIGSIQRPAGAGQEQRLYRVGRGQLRAQLPQVCADGSDGQLADGHDAFFIAFAEHTDVSDLQVHLIENQPGQLTDSNPAGIEQLQDGSISPIVSIFFVRRGQQGVDLFVTAVGRYGACAAQADGTVYCWGRDSDGVLGNGAGGNSFNIPQLVGGLP